MDFEAQRLSFGAMAGTYDAYRPEWPPATAAWLVGSEPGGPHAAAGRLRVVDLGAGTGKLSRTLAEAGHEVVAVDPSAGMLQVLSASLPGVETHVAAAEELPLPDASVDAVTAVQAWHWFRPEQAAAEIARILRPGGTLGVGWHTRDDSVPWVAELQRIAERTVGDAHPDRERLDFHWPEPFTAAATFRTPYVLELTVDGLVGLAGSWSYVELSPDRAAILAQVAALGRRVAGPDGTVALPFVTDCFRAVRP